MMIVDAHQDIAYNALSFNRDYRLSALHHRQQETDPALIKSQGIATIGLPDSLLGRVGVIFATLFVAPDHGKNASQWGRFRYKTAQEAYALALQQRDYYQRLTDEHDKITLIHTQADLDGVLETWAEGTTLADHRQGLVLLMENADPILEPKQVEEWYERGVRIIGPAWERTRYSGGTGYPGPLTPLGYELLEIMRSFNMILDLSHMAEEACLQALDRYDGLMIASHSNPHRFRTSDRHMTDDMILRLSEHDGVMGIVLYNLFLSNMWRNGDRKSDVPLITVVDAIDYVCQLTGSARHVGIGSDLDGGFGKESIPEGLDTVTDLMNIIPLLCERGYSESDIEGIMGRNMLRILRQALPSN
jgi:membrane dipeptidase